MARSKVPELTYREVLELARKASSWWELRAQVIPPRGPRGSRVNRLRSRHMQRALRAWSELGREGT
ncbi:MAG TPA: hypothetical protein VGJ25_16220 [Gaiellaceae bacterium]